MTNASHVHVVPVAEGWIVDSGSDSKRHFAYKTEAAALYVGRAEAQRRGCELKMHKQDASNSGPNVFADGSNPPGD